MSAVAVAALAATLTTCGVVMSKKPVAKSTVADLGEWYLRPEADVGHTAEMGGAGSVVAVAVVLVVAGGDERSPNQTINDAATMTTTASGTQPLPTSQS
jgi:hypothetical protein